MDDFLVLNFIFFNNIFVDSRLCCDQNQGKNKKKKEKKERRSFRFFWLRKDAERSAKEGF